MQSPSQCHSFSRHEVLAPSAKNHNRTDKNTECRDEEIEATDSIPTLDQSERTHLLFPNGVLLAFDEKSEQQQQDQGER